MSGHLCEQSNGNTRLGIFTRFAGKKQAVKGPGAPAAPAIAGPGSPRLAGCTDVAPPPADPLDRPYIYVKNQIGVFQIESINIFLWAHSSPPPISFALKRHVVAIAGWGDLDPEVM